MEKDKELYEKIWNKKIGVKRENIKNSRAFIAAKYLDRGERVLDIGCGEGAIAGLVKDRYKEICGVDISEKALVEAEKKGMRVKKVNLNHEALPYPENFFNAVVCLDVIEHILEPFGLIEEMRRVLKTRGTLILMTPNFRKLKNILILTLKGKFPKTSNDIIGWDGGHIHYFTFKDIKYILEKHDFKITTHEGILSEEKFLKVKRCLEFFLPKYIFKEFIAGGVLIKAVKL